jgi:signal transduction histidine kinase
MHKTHFEELVSERTTELETEIEQRKQTEAELQRLYLREQELRQQLQKQTEHRIWFSRALVHELKTPLTSLLGASDLLANNLKTEPWTRLANNINQSAEQLRKRIDELLMYTRGELGMLKLQLEEIDPVKLLKDVYSLASQHAYQRKQQLVLEIPEKLPAIHADPDSIQKVLFNLLDNAFKYSAEDNITVLSCKIAGDSLEFSVLDNGYGIPYEKQRLIFNPYYRIEHEEDSNIAGFGLGLSICKNIIELHKGKIWVVSTEGKGSIFRFSIPLNICNNELGKEV